MRSNGRKSNGKLSQTNGSRAVFTGTPGCFPQDGKLIMAWVQHMKTRLPVTNAAPPLAANNAL